MLKLGSSRALRSPFKWPVSVRLLVQRKRTAGDRCLKLPHEFPNVLDNPRLAAFVREIPPRFIEHLAGGFNGNNKLLQWSYRGVEKEPRYLVLSIACCCSSAD